MDSKVQNEPRQAALSLSSLSLRLSFRCWHSGIELTFLDVLYLCSEILLDFFVQNIQHKEPYERHNVTSLKYTFVLEMAMFSGKQFLEQIF